MPPSNTTIWGVVPGGSCVLDHHKPYGEIPSQNKIKP